MPDKESRQDKNAQAENPDVSNEDTEDAAKRVQEEGIGYTVNAETGEHISAAEAKKLADARNKEHAAEKIDR